VTVAVNVKLVLGCIVAVAGEIDTEMLGAAVTCTVAVPCFEVSATLVAMT